MTESKGNQVRSSPSSRSASPSSTAPAPALSQRKSAMSTAGSSSSLFSSLVSAVSSPASSIKATGAPSGSQATPTTSKGLLTEPKASSSSASSLKSSSLRHSIALRQASDNAEAINTMVVSSSPPTLTAVPTTAAATTTTTSTLASTTPASAKASSFSSSLPSSLSATTSLSLSALEERTKGITGSSSSSISVRGMATSTSTSSLTETPASATTTLSAASPAAPLPSSSSSNPPTSFSPSTTRAQESLKTIIKKSSASKVGSAVPSSSGGHSSSGSEASTGSHPIPADSTTGPQSAVLSASLATASSVPVPSSSTLSTNVAEIESSTVLSAAGTARGEGVGAGQGQDHVQMQDAPAHAEHANRQQQSKEQQERERESSVNRKSTIGDAFSQWWNSSAVEVAKSPVLVESTEVEVVAIVVPETTEWEPSGPETQVLERLQRSGSLGPVPSDLAASALGLGSVPAMSDLSKRRGSMKSDVSLTASWWGRMTVTTRDPTSPTLAPGTPTSASGAAKGSVIKPMSPSDLLGIDEDLSPHSASSMPQLTLTPAALTPPSPANDSQETLNSAVSTAESREGTLTIAPTRGQDPPSTARSNRWSIFGYTSTDESSIKDSNKEAKSTLTTAKPTDRMDNVATLPVPNSTTATTASASASTSITATPPFTATPASTTTATSITTATPPSSPTSKPMAPPAAPATTTGVAQETKLPSIDTTADANRVPPSPIHSSAASVKSSKDSKPTSASNTGTYGWRTLLGYGAKSDEAQPSAESMDYMLPEGRDSSEIQRQYYQEGEEPQARRTFAELTEIKRRDAEKRDREQSQSESVASKVANKVLPKRKNMVLPGYYEQFEECKPSIFQNVIPQIEVTPENSGKGKGGHGKSPSIMKSAVNALSSFLFSKADAEPIPIQAEDNLQSGPHGIHKVAIIGVHGWFPTKLVRSVIGEPTGTSTKFCEEMDAAFKEYLKAYDIELQPENITLIPLEGEGKVLDRVDILYENLHKNSKWVEALREANVVFVATHSQGTPTSVLLMARLIKDGLLRCEPDDPTMQRIGVLAMAGISHGPFPYLKGNLIVRWFEAEAAGELFEFMDSDTEIAKKYHEGLRLILQSGIRVTCVASLEDQVVPLYSAVMTSVSHPSIVRAIYIDGASYQDDFLTHLISFSLRLRNAGVEDHGVLVHLSEVIAGSLYGEGHSTIYDEREVYMLSIRSLLEPPTSLTPEQARSEPILNPFRAKQRLNPFYLPWGMRGVMEQVKAQGDKVLNEEMDRLRKLYDEWNPVSKGLKEIKFRLEPVRSKL